MRSEDINAMPSEIVLEVDQLTYAYPSGTPALRSVSFQASLGECVGLVGPNGAGKTTLFLCLSGVLTSKVGTIRVAGLNPSRRTQRREIPTKLGILFQNPDDQIFNSTVFDDVAFGPLNLSLPEEEVRRRVGEALGRVGLSGFEDRAPLNLSGGEKRRVALAGVLAMRPQILLLDEPSSHLDPRGRRGLIQLIQALSEETRLVASHDLELIVETCDRCVLLDEGEIIARGSTRELLADTELMEAHGLEVPHSLR